MIIGSAGDDSIDGLGRSDLICGLAGNDNLSGGLDNDEIDGGSGDDEVVGDVSAESGNVVGGGNGGGNTDSCDGEAGIDTFAKCETVFGSP